MGLGAVEQYTLSARGCNSSRACGWQWYMRGVYDTHLIWHLSMAATNRALLRLRWNQDTPHQPGMPPMVSRAVAGG